ncbi:MAG: hypothetical protein KGJ06_10190 [Pseudomonadota bacterium]|nr:hypothetical protein [Pseudomonadota bacterium]
MRRFVEHHFHLILIFACLAGLFLPGLDRLPSRTAMAMLMALMFVSCYRLRESNFASISWPSVLRFYLLRFVALPAALWLAVHWLAPRYATAVFLLAQVPSGVASPAFAAIFGGAVAPAFAIVIVSEFAAPFLIPLQFSWESSVAVAPAPLALFITMVWCIFVPMLVWAVVRHHRKSADYFHAQGKFFSILLVAFIIALAIAKQRSIILGNLPGLIEPLVIVLCCFAGFVAFGWLLGHGRPRPERIAYAACSGFNNAALGVSLALLHFGPDVILFTAVSEIGWALLPLMLRTFLRFFPR